MATGQMSRVVRHLRKAALLRDGAGLTDGELLGRFLAERDEVAFAALVRRHGPMVLGVCRRVLGDLHDAEDAFQATFLVLVRKAASVRPRDLVGHWLYGVAYRTALKARATAARRRARERQVRDMPHEAPAEDVWQDLQPLLDRELSRLPEKYRVPLVLCYLDGKSKKEAARHLGLPEGTVSSRLARARELLRKRLEGRGLALTAGALAAALLPGAASAAVPAGLAGSTIKAATLFAAGKAAAAGVISANVAVLAEGVLKAMLVTKLKIATAVLVAVSVLGSGAGVLTHRALAGPPAAAVAQKAAAGEPAPADEQSGKKGEPAPAGEKKTAPGPKKGGPVGTLAAVDVGKQVITLTLGKKGGGTQEKTFEVARDAEVLLDGKGAKLSDLKPGYQVALGLSDDQKAVHVRAGGPSLPGEVKAVDAAKGTIVVAVATSTGAQDKTFSLAKDVKLALPAKKNATLADVEAGTRISLTLSADQREVVAIAAGQGKKGGQDPEEDDDV